MCNNTKTYDHEGVVVSRSILVYAYPLGAQRVGALGLPDGPFAIASDLSIHKCAW